MSQTLLDAIFQIKLYCQEREQAIRDEQGLSQAEYGCIKVFPKDDVIGAGALSQLMGLSPSRGSRIIEKLVQHGYVERRPHPMDRRATDLVLSAEGHAVKTALEDAIRTCDHKLRHKLGEDSCHKVMESLSVLLKAIDSKAA